MMGRSTFRDRVVVRGNEKSSSAGKVLEYAKEECAQTDHFEKPSFPIAASESEQENKIVLHQDN